MQDLADFPITRYPHTMLLPRIWELHHNVSSYDAAYIALAELPDVPLLIRDRRLSNTPFTLRNSVGLRPQLIKFRQE